MTSLQLQERIDKLQAQHAAQWLETLRAGRREDVAAFAAWCRESPVHIREFLEASWVHHEVSRLDAGEDADVLLREIASNVALFPQGHLVQQDKPNLRPRSATRWSLAAAAAGLLVALGLAFLLWQQHSPQEFTTRIGEQRTVELPDTSVVKLNTDSQIQVEFAENQRKIELRHGEAVFKVAPDRARPFQVETRAAVVLAIGTQFNVYDRPEGTDVTVLEGRVRVTSTQETALSQDLVAGEQARIHLNGTIDRIVHPDVEQVTAWSKRRLKFERASLDEIVKEFNRYNRVQLRLEGVAPGSRFYRGIFDADDPQALASLLRREPDLIVEQREGEIFIREKEPEVTLKALAR